MSKPTTYEVPYVREKYGQNISAEIGLQRVRQASSQGLLAATLVEKWGMVAGKPSGEEDSAGRAKGKLMSPREVVDRACETSELFWQELEKRGWIVELPTFEEAEQAIRAEKDKEDAKLREKEDRVLENHRAKKRTLTT